MSALQFGQLPPGVKSWQALYTEPTQPEPAKTRWVRVDGWVEIRVTIDQVLEVEADESDDDIIKAALSQQNIDLDLIGPDWRVNVDYSGISIDPARTKEIEHREVKL